MRKRTLMSMAATAILSLLLFAGCGEEQKAENILTEPPVATETVAPTEAPVAEPTVAPTEAPVTEPTVEPTATTVPTETPVAEPTVEPTATTVPTETPVAEPTATPTPEPTATPTPEPTATPTPEPTATPTPKPTATPTPVPIVKVEGKVDKAEVNKVEEAFTSLVKKMRADGLVKDADVCVVMDANGTKADITFNTADADLELVKDADTGVYTLKLDFDFIWLEGLGATINGIDPANYNKELLLAMLSVISDNPQQIFDIIDQTYFSSYVLSDKEWIEAGGCYMMAGEDSWGDYFAYRLAKEKPAKEYSRDASFTLTGTKADGSAIECVIEYDSSCAQYEQEYTNSWNTKYEFPDGKAMCGRPLDENSEEFYGYAVIRSGISSYEDYQMYLSRRFFTQMPYEGGSLDILDYGSCTVNGYTYYLLEASYKSPEAMEYYDVVYVQIFDTECIEICGVWFYSTLEEFVNTVFYVK